jgi:hypothetical protein
MVHARPFWTSTLQDLSNDIKNASMRGVLTPKIALWVFGSPEGLLSPIFGSVSGNFTLPSKWGCDIPHAHVSQFLQGERRDMKIAVEWNTSKNLSPQQDVKKWTIKNHLGRTLYGFKTYKPFPLVIFASFKVNCSCVFWFDWINFLFCRYECGYGLKDHPKDLNHMRSIKCGYLAHFSIKRFYTWPDVVEITFYH